MASIVELLPRQAIAKRRGGELQTSKQKRPFVPAESDDSSSSDDGFSSDESDYEFTDGEKPRNTPRGIKSRAMANRNASRVDTDAIIRRSESTNAPTTITTVDIRQVTYSPKQMTVTVPMSGKDTGRGPTNVSSNINFFDQMTMSRPTSTTTSTSFLANNLPPRHALSFDDPADLFPANRNIVIETSLVDISSLINPDTPFSTCDQELDDSQEVPLTQPMQIDDPVEDVIPTAPLHLLPAAPVVEPINTKANTSAWIALVNYCTDRCQSLSSGRASAVSVESSRNGFVAAIQDLRLCNAQRPSNHNLNNKYASRIGTIAGALSEWARVKAGELAREVGLVRGVGIEAFQTILMTDVVQLSDTNFEESGRVEILDKKSRILSWYSISVLALLLGYVVDYDVGGDKQVLSVLHDWILQWSGPVRKACITNDIIGRLQCISFFACPSVCLAIHPIYANELMALDQFDHKALPIVTQMLQTSIDAKWTDFFTSFFMDQSGVCRFEQRTSQFEASLSSVLDLVCDFDHCSPKEAEDATRSAIDVISAGLEPSSSLLNEIQPSLDVLAQFLTRSNTSRGVAPSISVGDFARRDVNEMNIGMISMQFAPFLTVISRNATELESMLPNQTPKMFGCFTLHPQSLSYL